MFFEYNKAMKEIRVRLEDGEVVNLPGFVAELYNSIDLDFVEYHGIEYLGNSWAVHVLEYVNGGMVYVSDIDVECLNEDRVISLYVIYG